MCAGFTGGTFPGANFPFAENFTSIIRGTASLYNWFSGPPPFAGPAGLTFHLLKIVSML